MPETHLHVELISHTPLPEQVCALGAKLCYAKADVNALRERVSSQDQSAFLERIMQSGHMSVLEHASFTFAVEGVSRAECAGVEKQVCCSRIRLLKDVTADLVPTLLPAEISDSENFANTGVGNTGKHNTGNWNCGDFNTGNRNTGSLNSGDFNTGDSNSGIDNVGDRNCGSGNVGCDNTGHSNTGNFNKGSYNSGDYNRGFANSGSFNVGNRNSGKWNIGNRNSGYFNTIPPKIFMFNRPVDVEISDIKLPKWLNFPNPPKAFERASVEEIEQTLNLPNFDYEIFERITGVSKSDFERKLCKKL